jgi:hypothetical protein
MTASPGQASINAMKTAARSDFSLFKNMMIIIYMTGAGRGGRIRLEHDSCVSGPRIRKQQVMRRRPVLHREMHVCASRHLFPALCFLIRQST